jgi:hypothetical protein
MHQNRHHQTVRKEDAAQHGVHGIEVARSGQIRKMDDQSGDSHHRAGHGATDQGARQIAPPRHHRERQGKRTHGANPHDPQRNAPRHQGDHGRDALAGSAGSETTPEKMDGAIIVKVQRAPCSERDERNRERPQGSPCAPARNQDDEHRNEKKAVVFVVRAS